MMMGQITGDVIRKLFAVQITATPVDQQEEMDIEEDENDAHHMEAHSHAPVKAADALIGRKPIPMGIDLSKVGRNDDCPCGSGKKFKKCHGQ
jgi:preprotein translocase subunit SecA